MMHMSIAEQVMQDMIAAMKAKEAQKLSVLRMLNAALKNEAINQRVEKLDDETALKVIKSEVKKRKDSIESYEAGGRADLADAEKQEITQLESYLPAQMSEDEIAAKIDEVLAGLSEEQKSNFGAAMGAVMKAVGPQADGTVVRSVLQKKLGS